MLSYFQGTVTARDWAAVAVILSVTVLLGILFFFFVYTPQQDTIAELEVERAEVRENLARARETEANIEQLRAEAEKMDLLVNLFEQRLPDQREIPALLRNFERLGNELGLRVQLQALPTITDVNKETIPYKVTTWGDFHTILTFINLLERDNRYLKISDLDIVAEETTTTSTGTFTLSTFRFIQPASPTPASETT